MRKYIIFLGLCLIVYSIIFLIIGQLDVVNLWLQNNKLLGVLILGVGSAFIMEWATQIVKKIKLRDERRNKQ